MVITKSNNKDVGDYSMNLLLGLQQGLRMLQRKRTVKKNGFKTYPGQAASIVKQIIAECWNKEHTYFQTSTGHYCQFYARDFGLSTPALLALGYTDKVAQTLSYALHHYRLHGHIAVMLTPEGKGFDYPTYAPDSLAFVLYSLSCLFENKPSLATPLLENYKPFLEQEIVFFANTVLDKQGMVLPKHFSSIKDHAIRRSSCYDVCMAFLVQQCAKKLNLTIKPSCLSTANYPALLRRHYWTGTYFLEDLSGRKTISADAQVFPFFTGPIQPNSEGKTIFVKVFHTINKQELARPIALRYTKEETPGHAWHWTRWLSPGYETITYWPHLGLAWMQVLSHYSSLYPPANQEIDYQLNAYTALLLHYKTFLEVYEKVRMKSGRGKTVDEKSVERKANEKKAEKKKKVTLLESHQKPHPKHQAQAMDFCNQTQQEKDNKIIQQLVPYTSFFYTCDEGMLWSATYAMLYSLRNKPKKRKHHYEKPLT
ncbi:MAG: hypothetical protein QW594_01205 [Candidatus Woesearchaeota archaeon]